MPSLSFAFHLLFLLLIFSFTPGKGSHSFHNDHQSLVEFRNLIATNSLADWTPANPFCNWTGVTCNRRHPDRVASLNLTGMDLRGPISPSLGNLSFLRTLDLSENALTGHIPNQLGRLFRLRELRLDNNGLDGNIPTQLCSCRNLTLLALSYNNLTGNIPSELGSLPLLQKLALGDNELTGTIPSSLGNLSSLIELGLEYNSLTGPFPSQLISCKNLTLLLLSENHLTGNIPSEFGSLRQLQGLYLGENELTEYGFGQPVSTKGDIYSYGILLLEMLTRKRPTNDMFSGDLNLHKWVNLAFPSSVKEVIDNNLLREVEGDEFEENNVFNCISSLIQVGLVCSKDSPNERPTMRDVVMVLENLRNDLGANAIASRRLRQSISNLLSNTNATRSDTHASNAHSSSSF